MTSCVIPVLEKLKGSSPAKKLQQQQNLLQHPWNGESLKSVSASHGPHGVPKTYHERENITSIEDVLRNREEQDQQLGHQPHNPQPRLPRRDGSGFTITQGVGTFPNNVMLNIRHNHPTLGLSDIAYQREHQEHRMNPGQYQQLQRQLEVARVRDDRKKQQQQEQQRRDQKRVQEEQLRLQQQQQQQRGVLSLGLPPSFNKKASTLFKKARNSNNVGSSCASTDDELNNNNLGKGSKFSAAGKNGRRLSLPRKSKLPSNFDQILHNAKGGFGRQTEFLKRRPQSAHGDLIKNRDNDVDREEEEQHHYENASDAENNLDPMKQNYPHHQHCSKIDSISRSSSSGHSSGHSSGLPDQLLNSSGQSSLGSPPDQCRPPQHHHHLMLPKSLSPCPPNKMHPFIPQLMRSNALTGRMEYNDQSTT